MRSCRPRTFAVICAVTGATLLTGGAGLAAADPAAQPAASPASATSLDDLGRQTLPPSDGWASFSTGTTGGAAATADHVYRVSTRSQLVTALGGDNKKNGSNSTPKIIFISGTINGNAGAADQPLSCADYQRDGYTLADYLATYDPAVWGRTTVPAGPMEDARDASEQAQAAQVQIHVGSNTTLIGVGAPRLLGVNLVLDKVDNVIVRNLRFEDAFDCFPDWDPTDGALGAWNSLFDNLSLTTATHVWVDHNTFTDGADPDSASPVYFGQEFQRHDGEFDITKASDLVTGSWNQLAEHDKTMLIGSSNTAAADVGKLRVTLHHNVYSNILQRAPRVRFGQVHVYNNLYLVPGGTGYIYSWGAGVSSAIVAEQNFLLLGAGVTADKIVFNWGGTAIHAAGNLVNGRSTDVLAAFNAANPTLTLGGDVGWTPTLHTRIDPAWLVPVTVALGAGAGHLH